MQKVSSTSRNEKGTQQSSRFQKSVLGGGGKGGVLMVSEAHPLPQFLPFFIEWNIGGSGGQKGMAQQKHREKRNTERKETQREKKHKEKRNIDKRKNLDKLTHRQRDKDSQSELGVGTQIVKYIRLNT